VHARLQAEIVVFGGQSLNNPCPTSASTLTKAIVLSTPASRATYRLKINFGSGTKLTSGGLQLWCLWA
jgi:hypothetical protein